MDFEKLKDKAIKFKNNLVEKSAKTIANSSMVIKNLEQLEKFIEKSKTKKYTNPETWETKKFIKKVIVIFAEKNSKFLENFLVWLPILITKAFSQNIPLKISDIDLKYLQKYNIESQPCLVVFTQEKVDKIVYWEEKINKITKQLNLDLEKSIEENTIL